MLSKAYIIFVSMDVAINDNWKQHLNSEFNKPYFKNLVEFVKNEYKNHICYPKGSEIFNAFNHCSFDDTKVVIIGQDPYHGIGQANGLCFSVNDGITHPPSLINIFKEIETDLSIPYPKSGNLMPWADQGVLLLNATLTVRAHQAGSHQNKGWEQFTDAVIKLISEKKQNVVFLLWGGFAKKKKKLIDKSSHSILETGHPSPLSANRGFWFGNKHFSKTNYLLQQIDQSVIDWKLE
jgi:uracil-DNA glycosylase